MLDKNKEAALKTAISQLEKKYGVGTLMRLATNRCRWWT
jgi:recombination protein RecA